MRRRDFITLLGGTTIAWPLAARARQPAVPVIGYLNMRSRHSDMPFTAAFRKGLNDGVDGPLAASECQTAVIESAANGSHPWARLLRSDWTWRSMFFKCTGSMQRERRFCASSFGVRRF